MLGGDHTCHDIYELFVRHQSDVVFILFEEQLRVLEQSLLEFYGLTNMLLINIAILAVPKVRYRHKEFIIHRLTANLHRKLQLRRAPSRNLQKQNTHRKHIRRRARLQEFDVDDVTLYCISGVIRANHTVAELVHLFQMGEHVWRQVLYLVWDVDFASVFDLDDEAEAQELDSLDTPLVRAELDQDVLCSKVPIHRTTIRNILQQLAGSEQDLRQYLLAVVLLQDLIKTAMRYLVSLH